MNNQALIEAVRHGLLRFPAKGTEILDRAGNPKPFVVDSRGAGTNLPLRRLIVAGICQQITDLAPCDVVGGIANSGSIWAALASWQLELPFANIQVAGPRASGLRRIVEGDIGGMSVTLVDNWMHHGVSAQKAMEIVRNAGGIPRAIIVITQDHDVELDVPVHCVWKIRDLLDAARSLGILDSRC